MMMTKDRRHVATLPTAPDHGASTAIRTAPRSLFGDVRWAQTLPLRTIQCYTLPLRTIQCLLASQCKGKPAARRGRKASGLRSDRDVR
jgi:hypothetical protein